MSKRRKPPILRKPPLAVADILKWADAFYARWGRWPTRHSGPIEGTNETWCDVDSALAQGYRDLPRGSSLLQLLAQYRDYRHRCYLPKLSMKQVLAWADEHRQRTGAWPTLHSGLVTGAARPGAPSTSRSGRGYGDCGAV